MVYRLSALTVLLATLCLSSLYEVEAQQQQLNRGLRALPLEDAERKLQANENANENAGNDGNGNGKPTDPHMVTADPSTIAPSTTAPSDGQTADPSDSVTVSPSDATVSPTESGSTANPTQDESTANPTQDASTANPTQDSSTANPTDEDSTITPSNEDSTMTPSNEDSTMTPTSLAPKMTDAPTQAPMITTAPTEGEDLDTAGPTESPTADLTLSPTESEEEPVIDGDCQENPDKYIVMVDLQIDFRQDEVLQCTPAEEEAIADTISATLNEAFPTTVKTWDGGAVFGDFDFDDQQTYDDISEVSGGRQLRGRMLEAVKRLVAKRRRADVLICPLRGDLECPNGYCMWGCVEASTTLCGDDDSTEDWVDLGADIKDSLIALAEADDHSGYDCLGKLNHFDVLVTLEPGISKAPTSAPTEALVVRGFTPEPTAAPVHVFEDLGKVVPITTMLELSYFNGDGGDLEGHDDVELQLMEELAIFIEGTIFVEEQYRETFNGMDEGSLTHSWVESTRTLTLTFQTNIYFTSLSDETDHNMAHFITKSGNFHAFLQQLRTHKCQHGVDQSECNKFMTGVKMVSFTGTGTGRRLEMVESF